MNTDQGNWQKVLKEERLPHQLRIQSHQIDRVLSEGEVSAQVNRGRVTNKHIQFDIQAHFETGLEKLRGLKHDLLSALGVEDIQLSRENGQLQLKVQRPKDPPVPLLEILPLLPELEPATAPLGLSEDGVPVLLELSDDELSHILLIGDTKAGKTALLRTIAVSLAILNKQSQLQLIIINGGEPSPTPNKSPLHPLTYLPHLLEPVITDLSTAVDMLNFLAKEAQYRIEHEVKIPTVVVLIDHVVTLLEEGGRLVSDALITLTQKGGQAGIHLILSTNRPDSDKLESLLQANLPVRIVGRMESESAGYKATGQRDAHPEHLFGEGDFLAVTGDVVTHFQGAYIGDYDLHLTIDKLRKNRPQAILAQPFNFRSDFAFNLNDEEIEEEDFMILPLVNDVTQVKADPAGSSQIKREEHNDEIPFEVGNGWLS
jgi:DNA segregation ATPase FtsK/SpoIIIE, S-DNA-T family